MSLRTFGALAGSAVANGHAESQELGDEQMDQIRELLFGEARRQLESRLAAIEARLSALEARAETLARDRQDTLDGLAQGLAALGQHVKQLSSPRD